MMGRQKSTSSSWNIPNKYIAIDYSIQIAKVLITELIRSKQNYIIADDFNMLQNQETSKYPSLN